MEHNYVAKKASNGTKCKLPVRAIFVRLPLQLHTELWLQKLP